MSDWPTTVPLIQIMEHCKGGDLFKVLMMKGGTLDEAWVCREVYLTLVLLK